jgi:hypothetical protein
VIEYLELADYLLTAEQVLGTRAVEFVERNGRAWIPAPGDPERPIR